MAHRFTSYKLRFHEDHVRAVPALDESGSAFTGPGVDLRGAEARAILSLAAPLRAWVHAHEPGVRLRSLSVDCASRRVLLTIEPTAAGRPRVVRIEPPHSESLVEGASALERALYEVCLEKLRRRKSAAEPG